MSCTFLGQDGLRRRLRRRQPDGLRDRRRRDRHADRTCRSARSARPPSPTTPTPTERGDHAADASRSAATTRTPPTSRRSRSTNHYDVGSLQLTKEVDGDALENDPDLADGPFTLHVTCTLTDASHPDGEVVYDDDVTLTGVAPDNTTTIDDLATGASATSPRPTPAARPATRSRRARSRSAPAPRSRSPPPTPSRPGR